MSSKLEALEAAGPGVNELAEIWGVVRLGMALTLAQLRAEPLTELDLARLMDCSIDRARHRVQELRNLGRVEPADGGYVACPEWAHWTADLTIDVARQIVRAADD